MNPLDRSPPDEFAARLRRELGASALPTPSPALWQRIEHSHRRRRTLRRVRRAGLGIAALLLVAVLPLRWSTPPPAEPVTLEAAAAAPDAEALRRIDRQLQAAYDGGADPEQIATLWRLREQLALTGAEELAHESHIISL